MTGFRAQKVFWKGTGSSGPPSGRILIKRSASQPVANANHDQLDDPLKILEQLEALLDTANAEIICSSEGTLWKLEANKIAKGAQQASTEACRLGGTGNVPQLRFELARYTQLLAMDLKMLQAARTPETVLSRISQARLRCEKAIQLARATSSDDFDEA